MKIVTRKSDGALMMAAPCSSDRFSTEEYNIYEVPGWDWSLADMTRVDTTKADWMFRMTWNGRTMVFNTKYTPPDRPQGPQD